MDLSFYPLTLEAIDQADAEALCLFVGEDERPLTGLSGLADWRLAGGLSRMLRRGLVTGSMNEALLTPGSRLGFRKLFLFGLGPIGRAGGPANEALEEELSARVADCLRRLQQAGVEDAAMQLPSRLPLDLGIRTLIDEPQTPARALVFGPDPAALVRALSHAASRGPSDARHERRVIKVPGPPRPLPPVRVGALPKAPMLEVPKASPLPFAPSASRSTTGNASAPVVASHLSPALPAPAATMPVAVAPAPARPAAPVPPAAAAGPTPAVPLAAPAAPTVQAESVVATSVVAEAEVPFAPAVPDSEPPALASKDEAVAAPEPATPAPAAVAAKLEPAAPKPEPTPAPKLYEGKQPLPVDHEAPRFKPPKPTVKGGGKRKKR